MHVGVKDLEASIQFYSTLFGAKPVKTKEDYAKWMLEDPRLNFAISTRIQGEGVDHVGIQVENEDELSEISDRLRKAEVAVFDEGETTCCYAESKKAWVRDPSGLAWEAYRNMGDAEVYNEQKPPEEEESGCCVADALEKSCC
jgi:catechol 2,3-dioxygenase-like lactoylglutathione lyase family enzyme